MEPKDLLFDCLDILLVSWLLYQLFLVFRQTKAIRVVMGIVVIFVVYLFALAMKFETLLGLVEALTGGQKQLALFLLVFMFADEIKDTFAGIVWAVGDQRRVTPEEQVVDEIIRACFNLASNKVGALIAIARENPLDQWEEQDSVKVDSVVTAQLLETIFSGKTPLHDGAAIIRGSKLVAAKCQLPASKNPKITKKSVGMRHRAAFGLAEQSDAVVVIVSEERGQVSIAYNGQYRANLDANAVKAQLTDLLGINTSPRAWYHPKRLFEHGWLKLLAIALAFGIWSEQTTSFNYVDEIGVYLPAANAQSQPTERMFDLTQGDIVVTQPELNLICLGEFMDADGKTTSPKYRQVFPQRQLSVKCKNLSRLTLLLANVQEWLSTGKLPQGAIGRVGLVLPEQETLENLAKSGASVRCQLFVTDQQFDLSHETVAIHLDRIQLVNKFAVQLTGDPAKNYHLEDPNPFPIDFARLLAPSRGFAKLVEDGRVDEKTGVACKVSIEGRTDFDEDVNLRVPELYRRWNPNVNFRRRLRILLWSKELDVEAQAQAYPEEERRETENLRRQEAKVAQQFESEWRTFQQGLKDGTWDQGLRKSYYDNLVQRFLPDLERRIEKAKVDLEAAETRFKNYDSIDSSKLSYKEKRRAEIRKTVSRLILTQREDIFRDLKSQRSSLLKLKSAMEAKLSVPLTAIAEARKRLDALAKSPAPTLPGNFDSRLAAFIASPTDNLKATISTDIANAAHSNDTRTLFKQLGAAFDRWYSALVESSTLKHRSDALDSQIQKADKIFIHLELEKEEVDLQLAIREKLAKRQSEYWRKAQEQLKSALKAFEDQTALLNKLTIDWPPAALQSLKIEVFYRLFTDLDSEFAQILATRKLLSETLRNFPGDPDIKRQAAVASQSWWDYQRLFQQRIHATSTLMQAIAAAKPVISCPVKLDDLRANVETYVKNYVETEDRQLKIDTLLTCRKRVQASTATIGSYVAHKSEFAIQVKRLEGRLSSELKTKETASSVKTMAEIAAVRTCSLKLDEAIELSQIRQQLRKVNLSNLERIITPYLKSRQSQLDELRRDFSDSLLDRRVPELLLANRQLQPWIEKLDSSFSVQNYIDGIASVNSSTKSFGEGVLRLFHAPVSRLSSSASPTESKELDIESLAKLSVRRSLIKDAINNIDADLAKLDSRVPRTPSQESDLELEVQNSVLQARKNFVLADLKAVEDELKRLKQYLSLEKSRSLSSKLVKGLTPEAALALNLKDLRGVAAELRQFINNQQATLRANGAALIELPAKASESRLYRSLVALRRSHIKALLAFENDLKLTIQKLSLQTKPEKPE